MPAPLASSSDDDQLRSVKVHRSLTRPTFFLGIGWLVFAIEGLILWLPFVFFGPFSPITLGTTLFVALLTLAVRWARSSDPFAIEIFIREAVTPRRFEAQPGVCDKPQRPGPSVPPNL